MALPAPNLDDRRFQDLVDEAKRIVQRRCPEWSDHNVSDPGITLIETFAYMADQVIYRLNRVPDRNYVKFLDLIGLKLLPPTSAEADVTFWLSAAQPEVIPIPAGTEVATLRTVREEAIEFTTVADLAIVPCTLAHVATATADGRPADRSKELRQGEVDCFAAVPTVGDALFVGLSEAVPACAVALRFDCRIEGHGVDPDRPPLEWSAWDGVGWTRCEVERDETGGLNRTGHVVVHVPASHTAHVLTPPGLRAGWLRCQVVATEGDQPAYATTPKIKQVGASTIGGTARAVHAKVVEAEILGISEGVPGQRFALAHPPVARSGGPLVLEITGPDGWEEWEQVESFAGSDRDDRHFTIDEAAGEIALGPAVREPDGRLRRYGATPDKDATVRVRSYRSGGGGAGNVAARSISILRTSIPYVHQVENRRPATGGVDGEDVAAAKVRAPITLRTRGRAVTAEDYEAVAREAAPAVARVRCAVATDTGNAVRVLVVPAAPDAGDGSVDIAALVPPVATLEAIADAIDEVRVAGSRVVVEPPYYVGVTVVARLRSARTAVPALVEAAAVRALNQYLHPIAGGPTGTGWPFGRPVHVGDVYAVLQRVRDVDVVEEALLFGADPLTGERGAPVTRLDVDQHALVVSYQHQVQVEG